MQFVLFGTRWMAGNPCWGPSSCDQILWGPLEASGVASYQRFLVDEHYLAHHRRPDRALLACCRSRRPDAVIFLWAVGGPNHLNPERSTLHELRHELGIPLIALWPDTWAQWIVDEVDELSVFFDLNVVTDSLEHFAAARNRARFIRLLPPINTRIFSRSHQARDIPVSFNGNASNYPDRISALARLKASGIKVWKSGGQLETPLSTEEYAEVFKRSRIALNFSRSGGKLTAKGRTWEALHCGAMLIETANPETARWLEPGRDYVAFEDETDLVEKVRYYLAHQDECERIAESGWRRAVALHEEQGFFQSVARLLAQLGPLDEQPALACLVAEQLRRGGLLAGERYLSALIRARGEAADAETAALEQLRHRLGGLRRVPWLRVTGRSRDPIRIEGRVRPHLQLTGAASWFPKEEGTIFVEARRLHRPAQGGGHRVLSFSDGTYENYLDLLLDADEDRPCWHAAVEGRNQDFLNGPQFCWPRLGLLRMGLTFDRGGASFVVAGCSLASSTRFRPPARIVTLDLGRHPAGELRTELEITELYVVAARLPEAALLHLTDPDRPEPDRPTPSLLLTWLAGQGSASPAGTPAIVDLGVAAE